METVSCNDECYVLSLTVHVHIAAPLFSYELWKFTSSAFVLCSGADAPASTRSSSAFTCPWSTVEYKLSPFSTSATETVSCVTRALVPQD